MAQAKDLSFILLGEDRSASRTMTAVQKTAEVVTARIGGAFQKVGGIIGGEFGNVVSQVGTGIDALGAKALHLSTAMTIGGGVALTAGIGLQQFGSSAKQASDQLDQAITASGAASSDYTARIDKVVKKNEDLDHSAVDTKNALAILVEQTGDTGKALDQMGVITDLAAAKHISLSDAAKLVARIMSGAGARTLTQYGITMEKASDPTKALAAAQAGVTAASDRLAAAQKRVTDLQEIDHAKKKLTVSDHIALQNAQDAVAKASAGLATAQDKLNNTSTVTITKTEAGKKALDELAAKLNGQGKASVNNFGSQLDIVKTKVSDFAEEVAGPVGGALTALGGVATVTGLALDIYKAKQTAAATATLAASAASAAAAVSTDELAVSTVALDGAMDANPIGLVAAAIGGLALVAGGVALASQQELTQATKDYTTALEISNGVIDDNVQKKVVSALTDDGALKAARSLGIDTATVVQATLGNKKAQQDLKAALDGVRSGYENVNDPAFTLSKVENSLTGETAATKDQVNLLTGAVGVQRTAFAGAVSDYNTSKSTLNELSGQVGLTTAQINSLSHAIKSVPSLHVSSSGQVTYSDAKQRATGGIVQPGELTMVGERGPELVRMPAGSQVYPTGTGPASSGGGGSTLQIVLNGPVYGSPNAYAQSVVTQLIAAARQGHINGGELLSALAS